MFEAEPGARVEKTKTVTVENTWRNCFALLVRAKAREQLRQRQQPHSGKKRTHYFAQGHFSSFGKHHYCDVNDCVIHVLQLECTILRMQMSSVMLPLSVLEATLHAVVMVS